MAIHQNLLNQLSGFTKDTVTSARINDFYVLSSFVYKELTGSVFTYHLEIPEDLPITVVNSVKLYDAQNNELSSVQTQIDITTNRIIMQSINITSFIGSGGIADGETIKDIDGALRVVAVKSRDDRDEIHFWYGTQEEFDNLPDEGYKNVWLYHVEEEVEE